MNASRRSMLVAISAVALAGCTGSDDYWDDPPSFDDSGLGTVTDRSVPERPGAIPTTVADEHLGAVADRVGTLLAPIPEPLAAETLPNGEIRQRIVRGRERAREALDRMGDRPSTLGTVETAVEAREHAATAAGVWAAVSTRGSPRAVTSSRAELSTRSENLAAELPGEAAGPQEGAVVYGEIEGWLEVARRSTLVGRSTSLVSQPNPLRVGRAVGKLERVRGQVDAGEHLRGRYAESLSRSRPVAEGLSAAAAELGPRVKERFGAYQDDDSDWFRYLPGADEVLDRDVPARHPGAGLLSEKLAAVSEWARSATIAWPGTDSVPALRVRGAHRALASLSGIETIRERVEDGEDLFPADAATVRETRGAAIDAVAALAGSDSPLERWTARRLVPAFEDPDAALAPGEDPDRRTVADAYGEYVWIEAVARAVPEVTRAVREALPDES